MNIQVTETKKSRLEGIDLETIAFGTVCADHMFVADYEDGEWKNARVEAFGPMDISPATMALHYGQTIFEGMKAYKNAKGKAFISRPKDHSKRINVSAKRMCMPEIPEELFVEGLAKLISLDKGWIPTGENGSLYIRPFMFASEEHVGVRPAKKYRFVIFSSPASVYYSKPLRVKIETKYSRATPGGVGFAKAGGNYGAALFPTEEAKKEGFDQIIWTDALTHSNVEESGTMNLMFVISGKLLTPPLKDTILKGLTRDAVLALARRKGVEVEERDISVDEIVKGLENGSLTEAFGTGTAVAVAPIESITHEGKEYIVPKNGSISGSLAKELGEIRKGIAPDEFGWMQEVI